MQLSSPLATNAADTERWTTRLVRTLPAEQRATVARAFIGFVCEVKHELVSGHADTARTVTVAVEGVAQNLGGTYTHQLVVTAGAGLHDRTQMQCIPLPTVRSIRTLRRF